MLLFSKTCALVFIPTNAVCKYGMDEVILSVKAVCEKLEVENKDAVSTVDVHLLTAPSVILSTSSFAAPIDLDDITLIFSFAAASKMVIESSNWFFFVKASGSEIVKGSSINLNP